MSSNHQISLVPEAEEAWKKLFHGKNEFSTWVAQKLIEERHKEDSPEFLRNRIIQVTADIEKLQAERAILQKRLDLKMDMDRAEAERVLRDLDRAAEFTERSFTGLENTIGMYLEKYGINTFDEIARLQNILAKQYSEEFKKTKKEDLPKVREWLNQDKVNKARSQA